MNKTYKVFIFLLLLTVNKLYSQNQSKGNLAILPFKLSILNSNYSNLGETLPDMLISSFGKNDIYKIVERSQIDRAFEHFQIEQSGIINDNTAIEIGNWVNANWILLGSLTIINNSVRIDGRIVDLKNGTIVISDNSSGTINDFFNVIDIFSQKINNKFLDKGNLKDKIVYENRIRIDWGTSRWEDYREINNHYAPSVLARLPQHNMYIQYGYAPHCMNIYVRNLQDNSFYYSGQYHLDVYNRKLPRIGQKPNVGGHKINGRDVNVQYTIINNQKYNIHVEITDEKQQVMKNYANEVYGLAYVYVEILIRITLLSN